MNDHRRRAFAAAFRAVNTLFYCPVCRREIRAEGYTLRCVNGHHFDIAKEGYVNIAGRRIDSGYSRDLFLSRSAVYEKGCFDGVVDAVSSLIGAHFRRRRAAPVIADTGCGEGSLLQRVCLRLSPSGGEPLLCFGFDIAKEGIRIAGKRHPGPVWCVADVADLPLRDRSVDVIINMLAPANYGEFRRTLTDSGMLIKIVPGPNHLKEIRRALHHGKSDPESRDNVVRLFTEHFTLVDDRRLLSVVRTDPLLAEHVMRMTPLRWNREHTDGETAAITTATFDVRILAGVKKRRSRKDCQGSFSLASPAKFNKLLSHVYPPKQLSNNNTGDLR